MQGSKRFVWLSI